MTSTLARSADQARVRRHVPARRHYVTLALTTWTVVGLFVDVWAHGQQIPETFFSPYHLAFYTGFLATAAWVLAPRLAPRAQQPLRAGAGAAATGVGVFAAGAAGDLLWHVALGIERDVEALMSPPHLLLLAGLATIAAAPLVERWQAPDDGHPTLRVLLPALLSVTLVLLVVSMGTIHLWGLGSAHFITVGALERISREFATTERALRLAHEVTRQRAVANILLTNLVLLAPALMLLRRWRLPFGSLTLVYTVVGWLMAGVTGLWYLSVVVVPPAAGLIADAAVRWLDPSPARLSRLRLFATVVPLATWSLYFIATHLQWRVAWPPALWLGTICWTAVSGLVLSVVMVPDGPESPALPR